MARKALPTIYHLDGPGALRHLDTLLEIDKLDAMLCTSTDTVEEADALVAKVAKWTLKGTPNV